MQKLKIEIYTAQYQAKVQQLILDIQRNEFQVDIDLERQPDLQDISKFYQKGAANFWIAKFEENVIGTISMLDICNNQAALRKMFVSKQFRGKEYKTGQLLLDTLITYAKNAGVEEIYLGTTEKFIAAQRFYEKNGFQETDRKLLPENFPIMSVDVKFYERKL